MSTEYRMVDPHGNDITGQYISYFDQTRTGFWKMQTHITEQHVKMPDTPQTWSTAANFESLLGSFDEQDLAGLLAVAMDELARRDAKERVSARHGNPMRTGNN